MSVQGKVAIVTGAAKGIGFATSRVLGRGGASLLLADIDSSSLSSALAQLKAEGITATSCICDVSNKEEVEEMVAKCVSTFHGVDILVANAGILVAKDFLELQLEEWEQVMAVNLTGVFLCGQAVARQMVKQNEGAPGRGGAIVNMSSVNSECAIANIAPYNASKGGVNNLTRCMALGLAAHNIRVNAVGPGSIMTEVLEKVMIDDAARDKILSRTPLGRVGAPEEVGEVVKFLSSSAASYITGEILFCDGGRRALNYTVPVQK